MLLGYANNDRFSYQLLNTQRTVCFINDKVMDYCFIVATERIAEKPRLEQVTYLFIRIDSYKEDDCTAVVFPFLTCMSLDNSVILT